MLSPVTLPPLYTHLLRMLSHPSFTTHLPTCLRWLHLLCRRGSARSEGASGISYCSLLPSDLFEAIIVRLDELLTSTAIGEEEGHNSDLFNIDEKYIQFIYLLKNTLIKRYNSNVPVTITS